MNSDVLGDNAELTVAKRIPFRVAFVMDERKIPDFLAACANSPFRFETRQMRINRHNPGEAGSLDPRQRNTNQGQSDAVTTGLPGRGQATSDAIAGAMTSTRTNYDVKVEFYGIVKLYNPVNYRLFELQPPQATSETAALEARAGPPASAAADSPPVRLDYGASPMKTVGSMTFDQQVKLFAFKHWEKLVLAAALAGAARSSTSAERRRTPRPRRRR